jgi:hypothetical protein
MAMRRKAFDRPDESGVPPTRFMLPHIQDANPGPGKAYLNPGDPAS